MRLLGIVIVVMSDAFYDFVNERRALCYVCYEPVKIEQDMLYIDDAKQYSRT